MLTKQELPERVRDAMHELTETLLGDAAPAVKDITPRSKRLAVWAALLDVAERAFLAGVEIHVKDREKVLDEVSAGETVREFYALLARVDALDRELQLDLEQTFNAALCDLAREVLG